MTETNFNKQRIAKNTAVLALRMLFTMWINLYITRLVLQNLGIEDYGTYGIVGGVISMFAIFGGGLTNAINRFMAFELGKNESNIQKTFCSCMNVVFIFALLSFILLESIGLWFLNNKIQIPERSIIAANWVFQFSIITCVVNLISIPYNALIIAHERMNAFAYISIFQVLMNLAAVYAIGFINHNRLFFYGLFLATVSVGIRLTYQIYCRHNFKESKFRLIIDRSHMSEIGKFTGYSLLDGIMVMLFAQGFNVLLNINFGVVMNGIFSIATQVRTSALAFSQNVQKAIEPQIIKTYSNGETDKSLKLIYEGSRMQIYLLAFIAVPIWVRCNQILSLWLGDVPEGTALYVSIFLFISMIYAITCPVITGALATGNIKRFLLVADFIYIIAIGLLYIILHLTNTTSQSFAVFLLSIETAVALYRIYAFSKISSLSLRKFAWACIFQPILVIAAAYYSISLVNSYFRYNLTGLIEVVIASCIILSLIILFTGLNNYERKIILKMFNNIKLRIIALL